MQSADDVARHVLDALGVLYSDLLETFAEVPDDVLLNAEERLREMTRDIPTVTRSKEMQRALAEGVDLPPLIPAEKWLGWAGKEVFAALRRSRHQ